MSTACSRFGFSLSECVVVVVCGLWLCVCVTKRERVKKRESERKESVVGNNINAHYVFITILFR